jgi:hypothetical protein
MDLTGSDKRDFIKLKMLIYLRRIREQEKGKEANSTFYKSAGQVSKGSGVCYETCRALLLQRWNTRNWTQWYKKKNGEKGKRVRSGFRLVEVIDMKTLDGNADYRYGFRITNHGLRYLARAKKKSQSDKLEVRLIWEKKYNTANEQVVRINSPILYWIDQMANKSFYIRMPFIIFNKDGQLCTEDFGRVTEKMDNSDKLVFFPAGLEEAFAYADRLPIPPTPQFKSGIRRAVQQAQKEEQARRQNNPPPGTVPE